MTFTIRSLSAETWDAFAELVERNNGTPTAKLVGGGVRQIAVPHPSSVVSPTR